MSKPENKTKSQLIEDADALRRKLKEQEKLLSRMAETEKTLRATEEELLAIYNSITGHLTMVDTDFRILSYNATVEKQFGKHLKGKPCYEAYQGRGEVCPGCAVKKTIETREPSFTFQPATAVSNPVEIFTYPVFDEKGQLRAVVEHGIEATEKLLIENALKESEEKFRRLFNSINDMVIVHSMSREGPGSLIEVNDVACERLGYTRDELLNMTIMDIDAREPESDIPVIVERLFREKHALYERICLTKPGKKMPVEISSHLFEFKGRPAVISILRDITERKKMEQALRNREKQLEEAQRIANIGNWEWNVKTNKAIWSKEVYRIYGVDPETYDPTYMTVLETMHPESRDEFLDAISGALKKENAFELDYRLFRPDGQERVVHTIGEVFFDESGMPVKMIGTIQDITERKKAEEQLKSYRERLEELVEVRTSSLKESEEKIRAITQTATDAIFTLDNTGAINFWNHAAKDIFGYPEEEIIGRDFTMLFPSEGCKGFVEAVANLMETGRSKDVNHTFEISAMKKDGSGVPIEIAVSALLVKKSFHAVCIARDISFRKKMENEMLRGQKLEAIGILAGGIAHDFNNFLTSILNNIYLAKMYTGSNDKAVQTLLAAEKASFRARALTQQLLTFSKGGEPVKKAVSLRPLVEESAEFASRGTNVSCECRFPEDLYRVEADEGLVGQVMSNLIINSQQAMPYGGRIEINAENVSVDSPGPMPLMKGRYIKLSVKDYGIGIPEENIGRIFDPYFTTKEKNSGLGLTAVYSIIKKHDGHITVESEPGSGTVFHIYLPASSVKEHSAVKKAVSSYGGRRRILIMDDEKAVRESLRDVLAFNEFDVVLAGDGAEAVSRYEEAANNGRPFNAVIIDLTVQQGMGGVETINRLLDIDPDVRAIVSSGYSTDAVMADYKQYGFAEVIVKPYQIEDVLNKINGIIDLARTTV